MFIAWLHGKEILCLLNFYFIFGLEWPSVPPVHPGSTNLVLEFFGWDETHFNLAMGVWVHNSYFFSRALTLDYQILVSFPSPSSYFSVPSFLSRPFPAHNFLKKTFFRPFSSIPPSVSLHVFLFFSDFMFCGLLLYFYLLFFVICNLWNSYFLSFYYGVFCYLDFFNI
jgi:hypothetical protein